MTSAFPEGLLHLCTLWGSRVSLLLPCSFASPRLRALGATSVAGLASARNAYETEDTTDFFVSEDGE